MKSEVVRPTALILGIGLCLGFPTPGRGEEDCYELPESLRSRIQGDQDLEEVYALDFVLAASLTLEQARSILPIYEQACRLSIEAYEKRESFQPEMVQAFGSFLAEDRLNQGFSREVERRTAGISHQAKVAREKHVADMLALEAQVAEILTPDQRQLVAEHKPGYQHLARKLAEKAERKGIVPVVHRQRPPAREKRRLPLDTELAQVRRELRELNTSIHPQIGALGRYLLSPAAARPLYELAQSERPEIVRQAFECWKKGRPTYPATECRQDQEKVRRLRREINNWNLVNGLHLDREQIRELVALIHRREHLLEWQNSTDSSLRLTKRDFRRARRELEAAARKVLRVGQRQVLADYKACLIPPKNLKDPVRVGQAKDNSHLAKWLGRARRMKQGRLEQAVERLIAGSEEKLGPLSEQERQQARDQLLAVVWEAAELSDTEFELSREEMAERIAPVDRRKELTRQIDELELALGRPGKTTRLLLGAELGEVLRLRFRQLGEAGQPGRRDLASLPRAENCDKGCALNRK